MMIRRPLISQKYRTICRNSGILGLISRKKCSKLIENTSFLCFFWQNESYICFKNAEKSLILWHFWALLRHIYGKNGYFSPK